MNSSIVPVESSIFVEEGKSLNLMAVAVGADARSLTYEWNFGDDSATIRGGRAMHRYYLAGCYPLTLIVRDEKGAVSIVEKTAVVETMPLIVTALTSHVLDEAKGIVAFEATATSSNASEQINGGQTTDDPIISRAVSYVWNFGDGGSPAAGQKAIHRFAQSGTYYISVIASSPSGATAAQVHQLTLDKVIHDSPIKNNKEVLKDYPITFNSPFADQAVLETHTIHWDFGDGTTVENKLAPEHAYRQVGSYTVSLEITDEKGSTTTSDIPVEVVPAVSKILSLSANLASRLGEPTDFVAVIDNPNDEALTYSWDFGDGSKKSYSKKDQGRQVCHIYTEEGTYIVRLEVDGKEGSHAVEAISITVDSMPQIESIAYPSNIARNKAIAFSAVANNGQVATNGQRDELTYQWRIDKKQTGRNTQNPSETLNSTAQEVGQTVFFTFPEEGVWSVTLTVLDGTKRATETFDTFVAETELAIGVQAKETVLVGRSTEFEGQIGSQTEEKTSDLRAIEWDFGDGTKIESQMLRTSHIYRNEGSYTATLSATDERGTTATDFIAVDVIRPPLILVAGGRVAFKQSDSSRQGNSQTLQLDSVNGFCSYSGEMLKVENSTLIAIPEVVSANFRAEELNIEELDTKGSAADLLELNGPRSEPRSEPRSASLDMTAPSPIALDQETISEVKADDSVQYRQADTLLVEVPQHHDLVSDILLQTSSMGYNPTRIDLRTYRKQLKTAAGWLEVFSPGEAFSRPKVIEIERGPLAVPEGATLENMVIVVNRGDISLAERCVVHNVALIAQGGRVDLSNVTATNIKVLSSKSIQTTRRSHFRGNSWLASQQSIVFNGATVGADALLKITSQQKVRFNASEPTQAQILANAEVELCQSTTLQGSIRTRSSVIFNENATLSASLRPLISKSFQTVTLAEPNSLTATKLNIRLPLNAIRTDNTDQARIRVLEIPSEREGTLQLAEGSPLFSGKQLTSAELEEVSFKPASETAEASSRFVYIIEDGWNSPAKQTLSICFDTALPLSPVQSLIAQPSVLWPPRHQMVEVTVTDFEKFAPDATITLASVVCSEPISAKGESNDYDYEIVEKNRVFLRAVEPKNESSRVYKLVYRIVNSQGQVAYSILDISTMLSANIYKVETKEDASTRP